MNASELLTLSYPEASAAISRATHEFILDDLRRNTAFLTPDLAEGSSTYLQRGGKFLRPVLTMLSALAAAGPDLDLAAMTPACAAVECYHTATLVHDDVIDHDELRRGQATTHKLISEHCSFRHSALSPKAAAEFGTATAIIAGDIIFGYAARLFAGLLGFPNDVVMSVMRCFTEELNPGLFQGEQLDIELSLEPLANVPLPKIVEMMRLKTGLLLAFAAKIGAALGSATPVYECRLGKVLGDAAADAGIAFQIQDDILGMFGDEKKLGKPIGSDIREGKRTTLAVEAYAKGTPAARAELDRIIGNPECSLAEIDTVRAIIEDTGALDANRRRAEELSSRALAAVDTLELSPARELLRSWFIGLTHRDK